MDGKKSIESILDVYYPNGVPTYLVRWQCDDGSFDNSWESIAHLECHALIDNFHSKLALQDSAELWQKRVRPKRERPESPPPEESGDEDDELYLVSKILKHRIAPTGREYLVAWDNFPLDQATWEPEINVITNVKFDRYLKRHFPELWATQFSKIQ